MPQLLFTEEGGVLMRMINGTGGSSVKGQAVNISPGVDDTYIAATEPFTVQGFVYEDGVADGEWVWIVRDGIADILLEDGYGAAAGNWVRLSTITAGRCITQDVPGYSYIPYLATYTTGNVFSGTLAALSSKDTNYYVMQEAVGTPGLDVTFEMEADEVGQVLTIVGYYPDNHANGVDWSIWDYNLSSWTLVGTFPAGGDSGTQTTLAFPLTVDNISLNTALVRAQHTNAGNTSHRIYLNELKVDATQDVEHFKEVGHVLRNATAGTDVLARINIHFL